MDEFGVLVESYGIKSQGKSTPMANLKRKPKPNTGFPLNLNLNSQTTKQSSNSINGSFVDDLDGIFKSGNKPETGNFGGFDDLFGGPTSNSNGSVFDSNSVFKGGSKNSGSGSNSNLYGDGDDFFGGMPGLKSAVSGNHDVFGSMGSPPRPTDSVNDLLGDFGGMGLDLNDSRRNSGKMEKNGSGLDDLVPGFGGSSSSSNGAKSETTQFLHFSARSTKSASSFTEDPFVVFESSSSQPYTSSLFSDPLEQDARHSSVLSSTDMGNDLESFFRMGAKPRAKTEDPVFQALFQERRGSEVERTRSGMSSSTNKGTSVTNYVDDFPSLFGEAPTSHGEFQEIEGESEERRRARLNHHMRTRARMANALHEKNQRDLQTQREQEERRRLAENLDDNIRRWAAGKEGNLRALLSSLQFILWPECGWQPVSLTDLITSISVKKVYQKATLHVHPDKVQQKGANLQQKYIAEKVFDILKEAWNKFNSEELR